MLIRGARPAALSHLEREHIRHRMHDMAVNVSVVAFISFVYLVDAYLGSLQSINNLEDKVINRIGIPFLGAVIVGYITFYAQNYFRGNPMGF